VTNWPPGRNGFWAESRYHYPLGDPTGKEAGPRVTGCTNGRNRDHVAPVPWTTDSDAWRELDRRLPADHLARRIARAVDHLDLAPLVASYLGVGKRALRPDLLLKAVLYETHNNRPSPAQWAKDVRECEPVR
jgi:transposase